MKVPRRRSESFDVFRCRNGCISCTMASLHEAGFVSESSTTGIDVATSNDEHPPDPLLSGQSVTACGLTTMVKGAGKRIQNRMRSGMLCGGGALRHRG
jgi:hypothetical protein